MDGMNTVSNLRRRFTPKPANKMIIGRAEALRIDAQHREWEIGREVGSRSMANAAALLPLR